VNNQLRAGAPDRSVGFKEASPEKRALNKDLTSSLS
jgi:hypothetical protein